MRRIKLVMVVATVTVAMLLTSTLPAMAAPQAADSIVFFPYGNGATYYCTGGPPFVFDSAGTGNCSVEQLGRALTAPVCEAPTTITFVHHGYRWVSEARLCQ